MRKYKRIYEKSTKFIEMALIDKVNQLEIQVWTDHIPPHYHIIKKDNFDARFSIKDNKLLSYRWQKNNKEISSIELKTIINWLVLPYKKNKKITNKEAIEISWYQLNPD